MQDPQPSLTAVQRRTSHESVVDVLRGAILSGELAPGMRLVQSDLAKRFGVSTTPVREAMRDLVAEGLLEFDRYRGAIVHAPQIEELREIYAIRMALEPLAMRAAAANISPAELAAAQELVAGMDGAADAAAFVPLNRRFHEIITEASRLPRTVDILRTLRNAAALYVAASLDRHPDLVRSTNEEHRRILAALENRDGDRAAELIVDHLKNTVETLNTESAAQQGED